MSLPSRLRVILCLMLPALLVFACTTAQAPEAPSPTVTPKPVPPTPAPTVAVAIAEITFDGQSCQYEGLEAIAEGQAIVILNNPTDHQFLHLHVSEFLEGKTWQDFVEYVDGRTIEFPAPPWPFRAIPPTSVDGDTGPSRLLQRYFREWEFSLDPGSYSIICAAHNVEFGTDHPRGIWLAAPLEVGPDSSE